MGLHRRNRRRRDLRNEQACYSCRHHDEPGCAVRQAVAEGGLDADRLEHLHKLEKEARAFEVRSDARLRRKSGRVWGQLHDEVARLRRWPVPAFPLWRASMPALMPGAKRRALCWIAPGPYRGFSARAQLTARPSNRGSTG